MQERVVSPRIIQNRSVLTTILDDELILYKEPDGEVFVLNSTGSQIWLLCDGSHTVDDIAEQIARLHGIEIQRAHTDVWMLVRDLQSAGLIEG